jgi:hypothetical protein
MPWPRLIFFVLLGAILAACKTPPAACPVTEPVWAKPPEDTAVSGPPEYGYYFVNEDRSIWASAWWTDQEEYNLFAGEEGIKLGWFRPAGADLVIIGRRLDGESPPLEAHAPCCYPTRFQASGLVFPTPGCWEISATAGERDMDFIVRVEPAS